MPAKKTPSQWIPEPSRLHMPGYGLRKSTKGLLAWKWAEDRLKKSHDYSITTVKPNGSPHTMVVWGLWQDGEFLFSAGRESRKARNLAKDNRCCIVCAERADEAVMVEGIAEEVRDAAVRRKFLSVYEKKYEFDMSSFADEPIYAVRPIVVFGLDEKRFQMAATRWKFASRRIK
jgi:nitroimidazol reductase NimA-like FMN-containing flavoprotein (pyridoxamine 5'-phosphate oxidase superfamily)